MDMQTREDNEADHSSGPRGQESRFLPGTPCIDAEIIKAANVVAGVQNIHEQHLHLPARKYPSPLQLPRRAEHFHDRKDECDWLLSTLLPGRIVTICGPGGMGKTALVAEVLWSLAPGTTPPVAFPDGIVFHSFYGRPEAAVALEQLSRTFGEDPLPTPELAAQRVLSEKRALLVLDGVEEADHLEQVLAICVHCSVLVTSRNRSDAADPALLLDLQRLPQQEAIAVVQAWLEQHGMDETVIAHICQLVGGLPLALRLIGRYLALHPGEAGSYLAWLEEDVFDALNQGRSSHTSIPVLLERSVMHLSPDAQAMLSIIGLLAPAPFEHTLVAETLEMVPHATNRALDELVDYGLLVQVGSAYEVSHPLIHTYARQVLLGRQDDTQRHALFEHLVLVLYTHFPEVTYTSWAACERLVPHIQACATQREQQGVAFVEAASLFRQAGDYLCERVRYEQAALLLEQALATNEQELGATHPNTASSLNSLAELYRAQGKYTEAEPLYRRALTIREQELGADHTETATSLDNLAALYKNQGKYGEAEPLYQRALTIKEQVLGSTHPSTATSLNNLADLYDEQGKYGEAEPLYQRALTIKEQVLGSTHPSTATGLHNLAVLYGNQEKYEEAEPLYQRALAIKEQVLGSNHPSTASTLNNLAALYSNQERYEEAEPLYQRALAIREMVLGSEHPDVAYSLYNLANFYHDQGKYVEAEPLYQRALHIREQALGSQHPETARVMHVLALLREAQGNHEEARAWYARALAVREQALGVDHLKTTETRKRLIALLHAMGLHEEAAQLEAAQSEP